MKTALVQLFLSIALVSVVRYTEIDYSTYLEQVDLFLQGERNYKLIRGQTGPIVYPAGFLYIFSLFRWIAGNDIRMAQYLFCVLEALTVYLVSLIYQECRLDHLVYFVFLSKR